MAYEIPGFQISAVAAADMAANQFKFVKITASNTFNLVAAASDMPAGVLQDNPRAGEPGNIMVMGVTKVKMTAAQTIPARIGSAATGLGILATTGGYVGGQLLEASGGAGVVSTALINCATPILI
jgi:hypothetical protein